MKVRVYTKEQQEYRDSILNKRVLNFKYNKKPKPKEVIEVSKPRGSIEYKLYYMNNCIFWINEYREGRCDLVKVMTAIESLKKLCDEIKQIILKT